MVRANQRPVFDTPTHTRARTRLTLLPLSRALIGSLCALQDARSLLRCLFGACFALAAAPPPHQGRTLSLAGESERGAERGPGLRLVGFVVEEVQRVTGTGRGVTFAKLEATTA